MSAETKEVTAYGNEESSEEGASQKGSGEEGREEGRQEGAGQKGTGEKGRQEKITLTG